MRRPLQKSLLYLTSFIYAIQYLKPDVKEDEVLVVIGVLSAQNNSEARYSIRHTWKNLVPENSSRFYFLIGKQFCPLHPMDRISEYSCEKLIINWPQDLPYTQRLWTSVEVSNAQHHQRSIVTSFTFHVNFPVILRGIRILKDLLKNVHGAVAQLKNAQNGELITFVPFDLHADKVSTKEEQWEESSTQSFLLPRSFDGEFQLIYTNLKNEQRHDDYYCTVSTTWSNLFGAIQFTAMYDSVSGWIPPSNLSCAPMSMLFELYDLQYFLSQAYVRHNYWTTETEILTKKLQFEANVEKDILFLDVLDVYANLPKKILAFFKWITENINFHFLLKTDDDTFVDIPVVWTNLAKTISIQENFSSESYLWWWGDLRYGLPVPRHGKWQESYYSAPVYPPFPCGAGYVLHKNIIKFLVGNLNFLHTFQGEDTSLGIWLSGVYLNHPDSVTCKWTCNNYCDNRQCNRNQLSVKEMYAAWELYQSKQGLCPRISR